MKIYTRTGDSGTTGLFGGGRVDKHHPRLEAYGTVDEANSAIGVAASLLDGEIEALRRPLQEIQRDLFVVGADLATPPGSKPVVPRVGPGHVSRLEEWIDEFERDLPPLEHFVLPGGSTGGAALHLARTICRRAERATVALAGEDSVDTNVIVYLNRLSDFLFIAARWTNFRGGTAEIAWKPE